MPSFNALRSRIAIVLCSLAAAIVFASMAVPARAVVIETKEGATLSYLPAAGATTGPGASGLARAARPFDTLFTNLDYGGGPVMTSNTNYTIFWRPSGVGASAYPTGYQSGVSTFFEDLAQDSGGHENVESVATQYNDAEGAFVKYDSHFGGTFVDEDPYPVSGCEFATHCFTDEQIREELQRFVTAHGLPTDLNHEYFLLTPPGVESCFEFEGEFECSAGTPPEVVVFCAYHGNIPLSEGREIIYANDPFVTGNEGCDDGNHPNGVPSDGVIEGGLSHEHNESVTDPEPNNAWTDWGDKFTGENGDKCRTFKAGSEFGTPLGEVMVGGQPTAYNQEINGHKYWYQQEWSNKGHSCQQRLTFDAAEAPTATFTSAFEGGSTVKFSAAGSTSGAGIRYAWQFNDREGFFQNQTVETSEPTITHSFPAQGLYTVALTVFKADGTSRGTAREVLADAPPIAAFAVTTPAPTVGSAVSFDGSTSHDPDGLLTSYSWSFGDGSVGSGGSASHVFALPGTYEVTLTVEDDAGVSTSVTHDITVAQVPSSGGGSGAGPGPSITSSTANAGSATAGATTVGVTAGSAKSVGLSTVLTSTNAKTGAITLTTTVLSPGTLHWIATFQNGKFGAFASDGKCAKGHLRIAGRCHPATVVYSKGTKAVAPGSVSITLKPTLSGQKALKNALEHKHAVPVTLSLAFQPSSGGQSAAHTQALTIRPRK
jgi:PKD repeat protein